LVCFRGVGGSRTPHRHTSVTVTPISLSFVYFGGSAKHRIHICWCQPLCTPMCNLCAMWQTPS